MAIDETTSPGKLLKLPAQHLASLNKELDRLHRALTSEKTTEEDKKWVRSRIEALHLIMFGDTTALDKD